MEQDFDNGKKCGAFQILDDNTTFFEIKIYSAVKI